MEMMDIHSRVLRVHLHNSLAHLACYPLPRIHLSKQSSPMGNVIFNQLIAKSSSDLPPNSTFLPPLRQTLPDQTCTVLLLELRPLIPDRERSYIGAADWSGGW